MFEAGEIPCPFALSEALGKLPKNKLKLVQAYRKSTEIESALDALLEGAKEEWEGEFAETYCDTDSGWDALPVCTEHDFDWSSAEDVLGG
jgi:hypothetical protein